MRKRTKVLFEIMAIALIALPAFPSMGLAYTKSSENSEYFDVAMMSLALQNSLNLNFEKTTYANESEWIPLVDMNGMYYAHFIPLLDEIGVVNGYAVVSNINGDNRVLVASVGETAQILSNNIIKTFHSDVDGRVLIYEFPEGFFIYDGTQHKQVVITGKPHPVADSAIFANAVSTIELLSSSPVNSSARSITTVHGSLRNWQIGRFVPVAAGSNQFWYGGWQGWLTDEGISQFFADRSCGVTAAANVFHYMAHNVSGMSNLYRRNGTSRAQFSAFQREVYDYLSPAVWGIPTLSTMISRVENFASSQNVALTANRDSSAWNATNVRNYIARGLNRERPVMLLTWNSPIPDLSMHLVTITRIYDSGGSTKILTSNWGNQTEYDFTTWVNGATSLYRAVIFSD